MGGDDPIYTSGFPRSLDYLPLTGSILVRDGPGGNVWATNLNLEEGQSGSPIYDGEGTIIGIAKATASGNSNINYFIPIEFADSLLAQLRMLDIQERLGKIAEALNYPKDVNADVLAQRLRTLEEDITILRQHLTWTAEMEVGPEGERVLKISYEKMMSGAPYPKTIEIRVDPIGQKNGASELLPSLGGLFADPVETPTRSSGAFVVREIPERLDVIQDIYDFDEMDLRISILPTLSDGTVLTVEKITAPYK